jgi:predicted transcriptional regulator of viral defense system
MEERQRTYSNIPMEISVLREAVSGYRAQNNRISNMERAGDLIRLRRGLYVADPRLSNHEISRELIANNLYGPSYVSFESALSHHGLIPEKVNAVSSATIRRGRSYTTPLGLFEFVIVPHDYFHIGIKQVIVENQYAFLIASPEKAICDLVITTSGLRFQSVKAAREYLLYDMRINMDEHENWDTSIIARCSEHGRKRRELNFLRTVLQNG